jgi:pilus assembly protein CpaF
MKVSSLQIFLNDPGINELMWNQFDQAFVEWNGTLRSITSPIKTKQEYQNIISELSQLPNTVVSNGLSLDGILPDGSRFHITLPPLSPHSATLTIRKFSREFRNIKTLTDSGFLTPKLATFLDACVKAKVNILISGATGAGKTTLLNCLASQVDSNERIVTIEDIPELQLRHHNWVRLLAVHDQQVVTVRDCLQSSDATRSNYCRRVSIN